MTSSSNSSEPSEGVDLNLTLLLADIHDEGLDERKMSSLLPSFSVEEQRDINKYVFLEDRKRSILGKILIRALIRRELEITQFSIQRSAENKPYLVLPSSSSNYSFWNFNLSHHGDYVGIVGHGHYLIGLDIVDITTRPASPIPFSEYLEMFTDQLTKREQETLLGLSSEQEQYRLFFIYWSLKEAFVKAIGLGLGYDLQQAIFAIVDDACDRSYMEKIDGIGSKKQQSLVGYASFLWTKLSVVLSRFHTLFLDDRHVATVAVGPLQEAHPSYKTSAWHDCVPLPSGRHDMVEGNSNSVVDLATSSCLGMDLSRDKHVARSASIKVPLAPQTRRSAILVQSSPTSRIVVNPKLVKYIIISVFDQRSAISGVNDSIGDAYLSYKRQSTRCICSES
eukprot:scaffold2923_cov199-Ochromonas_danica.AAC.4